jgi:hypothetical protein
MERDLVLELLEDSSTGVTVIVDSPFLAEEGVGVDGVVIVCDKGISAARRIEV